MSFMSSIKTCFGKYVTFSGRAQRSELWWYILFIWLVTAVLYGWMFSSLAQSGMTAFSADGSFDPEAMNISFPLVPMILATGFQLITILPSISVMVRRLHDTNRSGWWYWIALVPLIGIIVLLVFMISKGTDGENDYGADPLA